MPDRLTPPLPADLGPEAATLFALLNEVAIVAQLSTTILERRLPRGLLASHFAVLNHLVRVRDGRTPVELARAFQVPKTTMTHTLAGLEAQGLVRMAPNPDDGRSKRVWIAEAGRRCREDAIRALMPDLARVAAALPPGTGPAALAPLAALRATLDRLRETDPPP
jgi:DNA-binding MarR family transcriptional regulator